MSAVEDIKSEQTGGGYVEQPAEIEPMLAVQTGDGYVEQPVEIQQVVDNYGETNAIIETTQFVKAVQVKEAVSKNVDSSIEHDDLDDFLGDVTAEVSSIVFLEYLGCSKICKRRR